MTALPSNLRARHSLRDFRLDMSKRLAIDQGCHYCLIATPSATLPLVTRMFLLGLFEKETAVLSDKAQRWSVFVVNGSLTETVQDE